MLRTGGETHDGFAVRDRHAHRGVGRLRRHHRVRAGRRPGFVFHGCLPDPARPTGVRPPTGGQPHIALRRMDGLAGPHVRAVRDAPGPARARVRHGAAIRGDAQLRSSERPANESLPQPSGPQEGTKRRICMGGRFPSAAGSFHHPTFLALPSLGPAQAPSQRHSHDSHSCRIPVDPLLHARVRSADLSRHREAFAAGAAATGGYAVCPPVGGDPADSASRASPHRHPPGPACPARRPQAAAPGRHFR